MNFKLSYADQATWYKKLHEAMVRDESACVKDLLRALSYDKKQQQAVHQLAETLAIKLRDAHAEQGGMDSFLATYDLSSDEGIALMCLAEALLRIPDANTIDALIADKISQGNWDEALGKSPSLFVNAATMGLLLTGKIVNPDPLKAQNWPHSLRGWLSKTSGPVIRQAVQHSMAILGKQFVMGETIEKALSRAERMEAKGYVYSFDMLGEAARTDEQAEYYFQAYQQAIETIGKASDGKGPIDGPGISIKLTGLSPNYSYNHWQDQFSNLYAKVKELALLAKKYDMGFTIDAEEVDKLELKLTMLHKLAHDKDLDDWQGLGLAVQAYQKRTPAQLDFLFDLAKKTGKKLKIRLVKGAYWDHEIKHAQEMGLPYYPVYTRKMSTDTAYMVCAQKMIKHADIIYPQFATHNAYTAAFVLNSTPDDVDFEMQRLHGMGEALYDELMAEKKIKCRIYAPVGGHQYLLAYLVRRLLENGANTSFVHQVVSSKTPIEKLIGNPVEQLQALQSLPHPNIKLPVDIYEPERKNAQGIDVTDVTTMQKLQVKLDKIRETSVVETLHKNDVAAAFAKAKQGFTTWGTMPVVKRAEVLNAMADKLEENMNELITIAVNEAGKTILNAINEVREAVAFCRYYAAQSVKLFAEPVTLPGVTGEYNQLECQARGVFVTISPWNFPLAIFTGQLSAALAAGNTVLCKPAGQTPKIAHKAVQLFYEAGLPEDALQLMIGSGREIGNALVEHPDVAGVMFTGSTEVAHGINQKLAQKDGPIVPLVAETGGQNAMLVDSSALLEQVCDDVIFSAFDSAGQRCSALRVLFVQEDIYDELIHLIKGAIDLLVVGKPQDIATDVGPVIDADAQQHLNQHIDAMRKKGFAIHQATLSPDAGDAAYVLPTLIEIDTIKTLTAEVFGPILHVVRFNGTEIEQTVDAVNSTGFGLTFGMHSRVAHRYEYVAQHIHAGNVYVNRNMIGAVVGSQPFGGQGLSGTGPKAGGPNYLLRLINEKTVSIDTTAMGGNASLLSLDDDADIV